MVNENLHLDMIGGIAGDMFIAACCDLEPLLPELCQETFERIANRPAELRIEWNRSDKDGDIGTRFQVLLGHEPGHGHSHTSYQQIRSIIKASGLTPNARDRADEIFLNLAKCEARVHGVDLDDVVLHEVGSWDSIVDILLSAAIIDSLGETQWTASAVPIGRGTVECAHGVISVPAPAAAELLQGFVVSQDEIKGERVTPTGAAILRHLQPRQLANIPTGRLLGVGNGFGTARFDRLPNVLRCYRIAMDAAQDEIVVINFDIDDQSPEDLALALDSIRAREGVLDLVQIPVVGKKGRLGTTVRVLARCEYHDALAEACLNATSTLGVRWYRANRRTLARSSETMLLEPGAVNVKRTQRPDGKVTAKVEADDIAYLGASFGTREALRGAAADSGCDKDD